MSDSLTKISTMEKEITELKNIMKEVSVDLKEIVKLNIKYDHIRSDMDAANERLKLHASTFDSVVPRITSLEETRRVHNWIIGVVTTSIIGGFFTAAFAVL